MTTYINKIYKKIKFDTFGHASHASYAMSFLTIFSMVPLLAFAIFVVAKFDLSDFVVESIKDVLFERFAPSSEDVVTPFLQGFLSNASKLGWLGAIFGLYSAFIFFGALDYWVQIIFKTKKRNFIISFLNGVLCFSFIVVIQAFLTLLLTYFGDIGPISDFLIYCSLCLSLFILFVVLPNTKINLFYAFKIAAAVALVILVIKFGFVYYTQYFDSYTTIYGSFAVMMFLLLWIEICWWLFFVGMIILNTL